MRPCWGSCPQADTPKAPTQQVTTQVRLSPPPPQPEALQVPAELSSQQGSVLGSGSSSAVSQPTVYLSAGQLHLYNLSGF